MIRSICLVFILSSIQPRVILGQEKEDDCPCPRTWLYGGKRHYGCIDWGQDLSPGSSPGGVFWCSTDPKAASEKGHVFGMNYHTCSQESPCKSRSFDAGSLSDCNKMCTGVPPGNDDSVVVFYDAESTCICTTIGHLFPGIKAAKI